MASKPSFFRPWERSPVNTVAEVSSSKPEVQRTPRKSPSSSPVIPLAVNYIASTPSPALTRPACTPSPADSAYSGSTSSCSPATSPTPKVSPAGPKFEVLEQWYQQHVELPYPSNKETKELGRQSGLNFHQVRKWMSKRRSSNQIASSGTNDKIYKDSSLHHGTPKKSSSSIMQKLRAKPSPYQLPASVGGIPSIAAGIPTVLPGSPATAAAAANLQLQQAQQFYMYQQEQQTLQAIYLHQLMAAQGLPLQHVQPLHTSN